MMKTNTEYMAEPARVERVVQRLMGMTIRELYNKKTKAFIDFVIKELISKENLAQDKVMDMTYLDFACLIDGVGNNPKYDWSDHSSLAEQQFYFYCLSGMLTSCQELIPVRLFLALPLQAFYDYLYQAEWQRLPRDEFLQIQKLCQFKPGFNIGDFLNEKNCFVKKNWVIISPLTQYKLEIMEAYVAMGRLLIGSFKLAFPERFNREAALHRYQDSLFEEALGLEDGQLPKQDK